MLAFGGHLVGFGTVNYFARNLDNVLIGSFCGPFALGLYAKAYSLLMLPIGQISAPITAVAVPTLSRLQNEPQRFRSYYLKGVKLIAYATMPTICATAVLAPELVGLLLGRQWAGAAPVFRALAVAALWQPVCGSVGWIYIALGQTRRMFVWVLVTAPVIVCSFVLGLPWGPIGVAVSYSGCICLLLLPLFAFATRHAPVNVGDVFRTLWRPVVLAMAVGFLAATVRHCILDLGPAAAVLGCVLSGGLIVLGWFSCWGSARDDFREVADAVRLMLGRRLTSP